MTNNNGAEGPINSNYIILWSIEDLLSLNPYYEGVEECDNIFFLVVMVHIMALVF